VILADASAWVAHLRRRDLRLVQHLAENLVVTCDVVVGELLLARALPAELLRHLSLLPRLPSPGASETGAFIERHREVLRKAELDWAQVQVLLTATSANATLLTADEGLATAWRHIRPDR
jgi:predicted nucleic acid-binding protein